MLFGSSRHSRFRFRMAPDWQGRVSGRAVRTGREAAPAGPNAGGHASRRRCRRPLLRRGRIAIAAPRRGSHGAKCQKGSRFPGSPCRSANQDGGRDKDRTCDPYDVIKVDCPETAGFIQAVDSESKPNSAPIHVILGRRLGQDAVKVAAGWLARNRNAVSGPLLPFLRCKFGLTSLEAIDAAKQAHALEYPKAAQ